MKSFKIYLMFLIGAIILSPKLNSEELTTAGTDFWITFLPNFHNAVHYGNSLQDWNDSLYVFITSENGASGKITYRDSSGTVYTNNFSVGAGDFYTLKVHHKTFELVGWNKSNSIANFIDQQQGERPAMNYFRVQSNNNVKVFAHSQAITTSDAANIYPTHALGKEYVILSYPTDFSNQAQHSTPSQFAVLATENDTEVYIETNADPNFSDTSNNKSRTITLDKGESYLVQASRFIGGSRDLTGSKVKSNKPVAVFSGHQRAVVPYYGYGRSRDILFEQMLPIQYLGLEYYIFPFPNTFDTGNFSERDQMRVVGVYDNTKIFIGGELAGIIDAGGHFDYSISIPFILKTSRPSLVGVMKKTSASSSQTLKDGDPFLMLIPTREQWGNSYNFYNIQATEYFVKDLDTIPGTIYEHHYATAVIHMEGIPGLLLDGEPVDPDFFYRIGSSDFYYTNLEVTTGPHRIEADSAFGLYVYGYGSANSYGYYGGSKVVRKDYIPPEIAEISAACNDHTGIISEETINDTYLAKVRVPDELRENIDIDVSGFTPGDSIAYFRYGLSNVFLDGSFTIEAVDSAGNTRSETFEIPGFTLAYHSDATPFDELDLPVYADSFLVNKVRCAEVQISNYGKFSRQIDSVNFPLGNFSLLTGLPVVVEPGETITLNLCMAEGGPFEPVRDTLVLVNECLDKSALVLEFNPVPDRDSPKFEITAEECKNEFNALLTDLGEYNYGIQEFKVTRDYNCLITGEIFTDKTARINIRRENPYLDMYYSVIIRDSSNNIAVISDSVPGFTISFESQSMNDALPDAGKYDDVYNYGSVSFGTIDCKEVMIYNYGNFDIELSDAFLKENIRFSMPLTDYPVTVRSRDSAVVTICYVPDAIDDESDRDTLSIPFGCYEKYIPIAATAIPLVIENETKCEVEIVAQTKSSPGSSYLGLVSPNPAGSNPKVNFGLDRESEVRIILTNVTGTYAEEILNSNFGAGNYIAQIDTEGLETGVYVLNFISRNLIESRKIIVVR
jgi:hypothetical protein